MNAPARILYLCVAAGLAVIAMKAGAQEIEKLKSGVVKITSQTEGKRRSGTGFIVRLDPDNAYVVTASHVVEGDTQPEVQFFIRPNSRIKAQVLRIEGGDPRGLALLAIRGKDTVPPGVQALELAPALNVEAGDEVTAIGFPQGAGPWAVIKASIASREGRDLTLSGNVDEGNSGGPVLKEGKVVGMVTGLENRFGRVTPASIVQITLKGWAVEPAAGSARLGAGQVTAARPEETRPAVPTVPPAEPAPVQPGRLTVDPPVLDFGEQEVCAPNEKQVALSNTSEAAARISQIELGDKLNYSYKGCSSQPIGPGQRCILSVTYLPRAKGTHRATLAIVQGPSDPEQTVRLTGVANAEGWCCYYGHIFALNEKTCGRLPGYFNTDLGNVRFQCRRPPVDPYMFGPNDCPPKK